MSLTYITLTTADLPDNSGAGIAAVCTLCGGAYRKPAPVNLAELCDVMADHLAINHPELRS